MACKLITRRLTNGWYHIQCRTCGAVLAVPHPDRFICPCPNNKMATPSLQEPAVSEDVVEVEQATEAPKEDKPIEESVKPKRRRRRKPKTEKSEVTE